MLLTKECDYALRIIRALADGTKKNVETIAEEQYIPLTYAYNIIKKLGRANFVQSIRGRSGGYCLHKPLGSFSLADVIDTIDSNRFVSGCLHEDFACSFRNHPDRQCTVHRHLARIQSNISSEMKSLTMDVALYVV